MPFPTDIPSCCLGINVRIIYDSAFPHNSCPQDRAWTEEKKRAPLAPPSSSTSPGWEAAVCPGLTGAKGGSLPGSGMYQLCDLETIVYNRSQQPFL